MSTPEFNLSEKLKTFVATLVGSSVGETISLPLNTVKVKLQLQGEYCRCVSDELTIRPTYYLNTWDAIRKIVQNHGTKTLLTTGLDSIYSRQILYNGIRIATHNPVRVLYYQQLVAFNYPCTFNDYSVLLPTNLTTCAMAVILCQPTTVIKGRTQSSLSVSRQKFMLLAKTIYREEGLLGFWRATLPVYLRLSMYTTLSTYFFEELRKEVNAKEGGLSWREFWNVVARIGFMDVMYTVFTNPLDLMRIRIINSTPKYRGLCDCMFWTMKHEGFWAFYKGSGAFLCCTFIHDMFYFFLYIKIKSLLDTIY